MTGNTGKETSANDANISPGNEGARGSRGEANRGAQDGDATNPAGRERPQSDTGADLRRADAEGGGGLSSESSRSFEIPRKGQPK